jgi:hypothetical protein
MLLAEMARERILSTEQVLMKEFRKINIWLIFTHHFEDRLADNNVDKNGIRRDNISEQELMSVFEKLKIQYQQIFKNAAEYQDEVKRGLFEGVIRDALTQINVPFLLHFNRSLGRHVLTCKTIMKKSGQFHTKPTDHVIEV